MKRKPLQSVHLSLIIMLALFQFLTPSILHAEECHPSLIDKSVLIAQDIGGEYLTSDSSIQLESFSMNESDFEISGSFESPTISSCRFSYSGKLYMIGFDDGSTFIVGTDENNSPASLRLLRLLIDVNNGKCQLMLLGTADDTYYQVDGRLDRSVDYLDRFSSCIKNQPQGTDALEHYSLNCLIERHTQNPAMFNNETKEATTSSEMSVESLKAYCTDTPPEKRASYAGYRDLVDDVNAGKSVRIDSYNINTSMFTSPGTHHDSGWGSNPFAFSSLVVANGADEYLVQVSLCDVIAIGNNSFSGGQGTVGLQMIYRGGFVGSYNKTTRTLQVRYVKMGLMITNLQLAAGGLTNKAVFTSLISNTSHGGSLSLTGYIALLNPSTAISSLFDYLTSQQTVNSSIFLMYDDTYEAQVSRYNGKTIRSVSAKMNSGYLNRYTSPTSLNHYLNVSGNVVLHNGADTKFSWKWTYTAKGSI